MADPYAHYRGGQQPQGGYGYGPSGSSSHTPGYSPSEQRAPQSAGGYGAPPAQSSGPNYRWWIPKSGIRRDVIQADIQRYLGPEALVKPGIGRGQDEGRDGYYIAAYRTLTPAMIDDLRNDSARFESSGERGKYEESQVHRSRQHWGPTAPLEHPAQRSREESTSTTVSHASRDSHLSGGGYSGYQSNHSGGYSGGSSNQGNYYPGAETSASQQHYQHYPSDAGYSRQQQPQHENSQPATVPRNYSAPANYGGTQSTASAPPQAPPGYYMASDGRYYPISQRPT